MKLNKTLLVSLLTAGTLAASISTTQAEGGATANASSPAPAAAGASTSGTKIYFTSLDQNNPLKVSGTLYMPEKRAAPCPAIVMVHGTSGINSVGAFYRDSILKEGIAIFEVDFKTGIYTGPRDRPSPDTLVALGFAALKELKKLPSIDPNRIGIMGFSMGGHLTVNAAFEKNRKLWMGDDKGFATHVAFYPVCKSFLSQSDCRTTGAPMIIFYGTKDAYGEGTNVPLFKHMMMKKYNFDVTTVEYAGACHDFNRNEPPLSYYDPAAIGGKGYMEWDADAANDSLTKVVDFLRKTLLTKQ
jgi:dienelactone hydrolase